MYGNGSFFALRDKRLFMHAHMKLRLTKSAGET